MGDLIMKKTISILLLCAMLLCACGETENTPGPAVDSETDTGVADTAPTETERTPQLPAELTFDGREVRILSGTYNDYCYLFREESTGEVLNDAIRQMQADTEERLDIKLMEYGELYVANANDLAIQLTASGDASYAVMNQLDRFAIELMICARWRTRRFAISRLRGGIRTSAKSSRWAERRITRPRRRICSCPWIRPRCT